MQYLAFSSNLTHVVLRALEIANGVDMVSQVDRDLLYSTNIYQNVLFALNGTLFSIAG